jgi:hypothetical protein
MPTSIQYDNKEEVFPTHDEAIQFIKDNKLSSYSISNGTEEFIFIGGKLLCAETPTMLLLGSHMFLVKEKST